MKKLCTELLHQNIERRVNRDIENGIIGGVAVAVLQKGEVLLQEYFSSEKLGISVNQDTLFRLASMTKPITSVAILILVDQGLIKLDDKVSKCIPQYKSLNIGSVDDQGEIKVLRTARKEITIRQLLTHTSGLGSGDVGMIEERNMSQAQKKYLSTSVEYYANTALAFEPGETIMYSGVFAFDVLARIVEIVSGLSYDKFLENELFIPLGMGNTTFNPTPQQWDRLIPMHNYVQGKGIVVSMPNNCIFEDYPVTHFCGGAGLVSDLEDYLKFTKMLLQRGTFEGKRIVSEKVLNEMHKTSENIPCGFGVRVIGEGCDANLPAGVYGWSGAYGTHFWVDPQNEIIAIYLKNSLYDGGADALTSKKFEYDVYHS